MYPCHSATHICTYIVNDMYTQFWLAQGLTSERDNEDKDIMTIQGNISPFQLLLSKRIKWLSAVWTSDILILHKNTYSLQYKAKSNLYNNWNEIIKLQYQQQKQYHSRIKIMKRHKNQFCWMHVILQNGFHLQRQSWISTQIGQWNCT